MLLRSRKLLWKNLASLHQISKLKVNEIIKNKKLSPAYAKYSPATLYRHALKPLDGSREVDGRHDNKGRPKLCTLQDLCSTKREINVLRETVGTFTSNILQEEAGVNGSNSTFRRTLRRMGCGYKRTRKEGMLTRRDKLKKFKFAKKVKKLFSHHDCGSRVVWTRRISMYVDGVGFSYKSNPYLHSKTPGARSGD